MQSSREIGQASQAVLNALRRGEASIVGTFKADTRSTVQLVAHAGRQWIVKWYPQSMLAGWWTGLSRISPAWREVKGAAMLARCGVRVNRPVLLRHCGGFAGGQMLVLRYVQGRSLYHELFEDAPPAQRSPDRRRQRRRVARGVGEHLGRLIAAGLVNRDCKPSNLIVDDACRDRGEPPIVIDTVGVRESRDFQQVLAMLLTLLRATYQAGGATRRERLSALIVAMRQGDLSRREAHQLAVLAAGWLDEQLGAPPLKDADRRPADHPSRQPR